MMNIIRDERRVVCAECGKEVRSIKEMIDHYKEHPEIKVIDGVNEAEAMEYLERKGA